MQPDFMVIGAHRCGTTSIFRALSEHPQILRPPVNKGTDYYTLYYDHGHDWYRGHFPIANPAKRRAPETGRPLTFEACTYYLYHPFAMSRIAKDYPSMKLVVMLRDPVERAWSAYKHEFARGFEWESFDRALALEDDRLVGEVDRMREDVTYESFAHRHHGYRLRGQYAEQLTRAFESFPRDQLHILDSESFFAEPDKEYQRLIDFLGAEPFRPARFDQNNARPSSPMPADTKQFLQKHFAPQNEALAEILGRAPGWM
jgi:hypothetical protein